MQKSSLPSHLQKTEKRLVRLFMMWIFLFLLCFEVFFLGTRYFVEKNLQEQNFTRDSERIVSMNSFQGDFLQGNDQQGNDQRGPMNIGFVIFDASGNILDNRLPGQNFSSLSGILEDGITSFPENVIVYREGFLMRKTLTRDGNILIAVTAENYTFDGVLRDFLQFFLMDILIVIPFFFLVRFYVRETLQPVKENLDTMMYFVHDAGHELKTPLAIASGTLQLLRDSKKPDMSLVGESLSAIESMNASIEGLLELADLKLPEHDHKVFLFSVAEMEIEKLQAFYPNISIKNLIPENAIIYSSKRHISLLFHNLIENALKYNTENGSVEILFSSRTLTVKDTGVGISESDQERIFDRFYRVDPAGGVHGSGIGLALVARITKLYHWDLSVESEKGKGTSISIKM